MSRELSDWQELLDSFTKLGAKQGKVKTLHLKINCGDRVKFLLEDGELR